jgi:sulfonate transport system ATP-binding protein
MFQEPRLLPWARVLSNVEVGLGRERNSPDAQARAESALVEVGLAEKRTQWPAVLSADRSSVWRWRARWSASRVCSRSTSRSAHLTP